MRKHYDYDYFISYTNSDLGWAHWVSNILENNGFSTIYQDRDFDNTILIASWINEYLYKSKAVIALVSPSYCEINESNSWRATEWSSALREKKLTLARVSDFNLPPVLGALAYIDLFGIDEADATISLMKGLNLRIPNPAMRPPASIDVTFPGSVAERDYLRPNMATPERGVQQHRAFIDCEQVEFGGMSRPALGNTAILSRISNDGSMGVYRGIQTLTLEEVAVKILPPADRKRNQTLRPRLQREAHFAPLLGSTHVVRVFRIDKDLVSKNWYLIMEYVHGISIKSWIVNMLIHIKIRSNERLQPWKHAYQL